MLPAIQLDNESSFRATEINHEAIDRHLPFELQTVQTSIAQLEPKHTLSVCLVATKAFG